MGRESCRLKKPAKELKIKIISVLDLSTILCFQIPEDTVKNSRFSYIEKGEPVSLEQLGKSKSSLESGYQTYIESCIAGLLKVLNWNAGFLQTVLSQMIVLVLSLLCANNNSQRLSRQFPAAPVQGHSWLAYSTMVACWLVKSNLRSFTISWEFLVHVFKALRIHCCMQQKTLFREIVFLKENCEIYLYIASISLQEAKDKFKGWVSQPWYDSSVEISYKKVKDGYPLRLWRCVVEVNASPDDVIRRILYER